MKSKMSLIGILPVIIGLIFLLACNSVPEGPGVELDREAIIEPDYSGVTIPRNIAPLNLFIKEDGKSFRAVVSSESGLKFSTKSADGNIRFSLKQWKNLLSDTSSHHLTLEFIILEKDNTWTRYKPIQIKIVNEPADPYICYRLLYPGYETWSGMEIIQRCVENFSENAILENQSLDNNCINCHTFNQNDPEKFLVHIRGSMGGTYFVNGNKITRTDLKTEEVLNGATYPCWHPGGEIVAFSSNKVIQSFQSASDRNIEVFDLASSLILYDLAKNEILNVPAEDTFIYMETFPEWSPDGKYLYYCRTNQFIEGSDLKDVRYDLVRRSFNQDSMTFGKSEVIFNAKEINKSVSFPKISPDGKYLVFTLHDYGTFSIWHKEADLYLVDLSDGKTTKMSLNSDETESYHTWSSNSKWLVFSSKRGDGLTARPYFAYVGSPGQIGKPFILPQKDPGKYNEMLKTFNRPEFVKGKIKPGPRDFSRVAKGDAVKAKMKTN